MQTVQLQCGSCNNMMAISMEHLGAQVQCPHCRAIVQTPPASAFGAPPPGPDPMAGSLAPPQEYAPPTPPAPQPPPQPQPSPVAGGWGAPPPAPAPYTPPKPADELPESIFSGPAPSDDLFGDAPTPKVQMPEPPRPTYDAVPSHAALPEHAAAPEPVAEHHEAEVEQAEDHEMPADLAGMQERMRMARQSSNLAPTILVFLVPYAVCCTLFIGYLLYNWPSIDRLDYLPDPKRDGAKRASVVFLPAHDSPLAATRKVTLNQTVRVGATEVTPLKVIRTEAGDLQLEFRVRNVSTDVTLKPIEMEFFKYDRRAAAGVARPYTFLEHPGLPDRVYGGYVEYFQGAPRRDHSGELHPGQEEIVLLTTEPGDAGRVKTLTTGTGRLLWRLQIRRGLVPYRGSEIPATAVVGVEFTSQEIGREQG